MSENQSDFFLKKKILGQLQIKIWARYTHTVKLFEFYLFLSSFIIKVKVYALLKFWKAKFTRKIKDMLESTTLIQKKKNTILTRVTTKMIKKILL